MSTDHEMTSETQGSSRRALLKGAVAVGVGAAVYTAPIVGTVPAYATHGLNSWSTTSGDLCIWFSPNQNSDRGKWRNVAAGTVSADTASETLDTPILSSTYTVGAISRTVIFQGNPNNRFLGVAGTNSTNGRDGGDNSAFCTCPATAEGLGCAGCPDPYEFYGGGAGIRLTAPTCEFVVVRVLCRQQSNATCDTTNINAAPASWANGSSLASSINTKGAPAGNVGGGRFQGNATRVVRYHTGRTGANAGSRCKFQIVFRIRCA